MVKVCMAVPHEASILRPEYGETEYGGQTQSRSTVASGVKCFVQNMKIAERSAYAKKMIGVEVKIYFTDEPNLREGDFITITRNTQCTSYIGQTFEFISIDDSSAGFGIIWKAVCKREVNPPEPNPPE